MVYLPLKFPENNVLRFLIIGSIAIIGAILLSIIVNSFSFSQKSSIPLAGGETTVFNRSSHALSQPAPNLTEEELTKHLDGDADFDAVFVTAPAQVNPGLGPVFNNASCNGCHLKDGRGMPQPGQSLVRVSLPEGEPEVPGGSAPVPGIGTQIRDQAVYGHQPQALVKIEWQEREGKYPDGALYKLRSPRLQINLPNGQPLSSEILTSLRVPPPVFGRGLLEAVDEKTILALADPEDKNKDGISGRPNYVWDVEKKRAVLGRFGLKANTPTLLQQTAAAYINDMGVTNPLFPDKDGSTDIDRQTLEDATFYGQTLAVPARTLLDDPVVKQGEKLFDRANCSACHIPQLSTSSHAVKALANQKIHPYTDLLLHDLGAELADGRPDFQASGSEWRTTPLWGVGLTQTVLPYSAFLHDGRARTLEEAILWHSGEAQQSREAFQQMPKSDRIALLKFLSSL